MKRWIERGLVLQHAVANVEELPHRSADDHHFFFPPLREPIAEGFDRGVAPSGWMYGRISPRSLHTS